MGRRADVGARWRWLVRAAIACSLAACAEDRAGLACDAPLAIDGGVTALPPDIDGILERRCRECHTDPPQMFAPMPLLSWEHVQAPMPAPRDDEPVYQYIGARIDDERYPMPPVTRPQLTPQERAALNAWIEDCAPAAEH